MSESVAALPDARPRPNSRPIPGEIGIWVFVLGDMTMFSAFFTQFVYDRADQVDLFQESQGHAHVAFGAMNTILLLTGSLFVVYGVRAAKSFDLTMASRWFAFASVSGGVFLLNKVLEYADKVQHGLTPVTNDYFTYYFMFTGIHAIHLIAGLAVLAHLRRICADGAGSGMRVGDELEARQLRTIEVGATYWHLVDLLWIVLFALLYLMA